MMPCPPSRQAPLPLVKQAEPNGLIRYSVNPLSMEDDDLRRLMNS